jgi:aspartyl-tRNA(Asn)/glutamyl-tRNA(Gln) amidotransferase subunit A
MDRDSKTDEKRSPSNLITQWSRQDCRAEHLVDLCMDSIRRNNPLLRALITVAEEQAEDDARALDGTSGPLPLRGMPISIKDIIATEGVRTTMGSRFFSDHVPDNDAEVVRRLKQAGAIIVGKANLHEFAFGATSQNEHYGSCRNPWNISRIPGGSSGGSAASVAAEMCIGSLGTDTGGSVRCPASFVGITGLRPTIGRISNRGVFPVSARFDTVGPMAYRTVDVARMFYVIAGYDELDPISVDRPGPDSLSAHPRSFNGMRIGLPRSFFFEDCDQDVLNCIDDFVRLLRDAGARVTELDLAGGAEASLAFSNVLALADCAEVHRERLEMHGGLFGSDIRQRLTMGQAVSGIDYAKAMRVQEHWIRTIQRAFRDQDLLVTPTCPVAAPRAPHVDDAIDTSRNVNRLNFAGTMAGVPSITLPCGFTQEGLPVGVQLVSRWWQEPSLLQAGIAYQKLTDWHDRRPASMHA